MNFESALPLLKKGECIKRASWGQGYIFLEKRGFSDVIRFKSNVVAEMTWMPKTNDLLAENWALHTPAKITVHDSI